MPSRMMLALWIALMGGSAYAADDHGEQPPMPQVITDDAPAAANTPPSEAPPPAATPDTPPPAEDVMEQMLQQQQESPIIEPTVRPSNDPTRRDKAPTASVKIDSSVLGIAPGGKQPTLRREGEFIVSRRGRLVRSSDGAHMLYVFDSDDKDSPEAPLIILPCQMLQSMEDIVQQRGDRVVFILSGQITTYRGSNYVIPTMMKLAIDRGNIQ